MRQTRVVRLLGIRRIAAQNNLLDAKAFGGAENRTNVVGRADIMGDKNDFWH